MIRQEPADVEIAGVLCHSHADVLRELDQLAFSLLATLEDCGFQPAD
jgi:hypothetical protein